VTHFVEVACDCEEGVEHCRMNLYVSDVRIAYASINATRRRNVDLLLENERLQQRQAA
jgi:hypothetical protein